MPDWGAGFAWIRDIAGNLIRVATLTEEDSRPGGVTPTLAEVLAEGNEAGDAAISMSSGSISGSEDNFYVAVRGAQGAADENGRSVIVQGGPGDGGNSSGASVTAGRGLGNGTGGSVQIDTGGASPGSDADGGDITLTPGAGDGVGRAGRVVVNGDIRFTTDPEHKQIEAEGTDWGRGGWIEVRPPNEFADKSGDAGIIAGEAEAGHGGGDAILYGGERVGGSQAGYVIAFGTGADDSGGGVLVQGGSADSNQDGGDVTLTAGAGDGAGSGGNGAMIAGVGVSGGKSSIEGGESSANDAGQGSVTAFGAWSTGRGGDVWIFAGGADGDSNDGGDVVLTPGAGVGDGADGKVVVGEAVVRLPMGWIDGRTDLGDVEIAANQTSEQIGSSISVATGFVELRGGPAKLGSGHAGGDILMIPGEGDGAGVDGKIVLAGDVDYNGHAPTLAEVLAEGNVTGETPIGGPLGSLNLQTSNGEAALYGADGAGDDSAPNVVLAGGAGLPSDRGGQALVLGGVAGSGLDGEGGSAFLRGGGHPDGNTGGEVRAYGAIGGGEGGAIKLNGGVADGGSGALGGDIRLLPGAGDGAGRHGLVFLNLPTSDPAAAGGLWSDNGRVTDGASGTPTLAEVLVAGNDVGGLPIVGGDAEAASDAPGGDVALTAGDGDGSGQGGTVTLNAGNANAGAGAQIGVGGGNIDGGAIILTAGDGEDGGLGGDITLTAGAGDGAGRNGLVFLNLPTSDPLVAGALYSDGVPSAGVPKAIMVSGG